jgi:hypothetical protein
LRAAGFDCGALTRPNNVVWRSCNAKPWSASIVPAGSFQPNTAAVSWKSKALSLAGAQPVELRFDAYRADRRVRPDAFLGPSWARTRAGEM